MKFREIRGGLIVPISNEEQSLMEKVEANEGQIDKKVLDERERELARHLVRKGALNRYKRDDQTVYVINDLEDLWR